MNRLIILGNGFDLAHGMKTSYSHFMDWVLLEVVKRESKLDGLMHCRNYQYFSGVKDQIKYIKDNWSEFLTDKILTLNNSFFEHLIGISNSLNWVDIENEYYNALLKLSQKRDNEELIITLNKELDEIKRNLEIYLNTVQLEFSMNRYDLDYDRILFKDLYLSLSNNIIGDKVLILNFNYTNTCQYYQNKFTNSFLIDKSRISIVNIHGKLNDPDNPIIFGYGDEKHKDFDRLLHDGNNDLLKNVKHYKYPFNRNFKKLENFLESKFEVYILGHSCGNSDRTLFNTIFESEKLDKNGIKIFLPDFDNESFKKEHFGDIVIQISRSLNSSGTIRTKLLNYTECQTMPSFEKLK